MGEPSTAGIGDIIESRPPRRQRPRYVGLAVVVALAAAMAIPVALAERADRRTVAAPATPSAGSEPTSSPTPTSDPSAEENEGDGKRAARQARARARQARARVSLEQALARLPRGPRPAVPFVDGAMLHVNGRQVKLTNRRFVPRQQTRYGLLALLHSTGFTGAEDYEARYGLLDDDGSFDPLAHGVPLGAAVSPDGERAALGVAMVSQSRSRIVVRAVELASGATLDELRVTADTSVLGWWRDAVMLGSYRGPVRLWEPGGEPRMVLPPPLVVADFAGGLLVFETKHGRCSHVLSLRRLHHVQALECGGKSVETVSPFGRWALLRNSTLIDLNGEFAPFLLTSWPASQIVWEDSEHLLFQVYRSGRRPDVVVRCAISDGACERAYTQQDDHPLADLWLADAP